MVNRLMSPGPTPLPEEVRHALSLPMIHHRTPAYKALMLECLAGLKTVFGTTQDVLIMQSVGTGAMEALVTNLFAKGDKVLVLGAGKFTERWVELGKAYGLDVAFPPMTYGQAVTAEVAAAALKAHPDAKGVFTQHVETSTGTLNDIEALGKAVQASPNPPLLVVDTVSGLAGDKILMDAWGIDVLISGSQKGLMLAPGLAFISLSPRAWEVAAKNQMPRYYFGLPELRKELADGWDRFSGAVNLIQGLAASLRLIQAQGMERIWTRHEVLAQAVRAAVTAHGLELFSERPANVVTAVKVPEGVNGEKIPSRMRDFYGVTIAGGQGSMKGKVFRLAHMGYMGRMDIITGLAAMEMALADQGLPIQLGKGVAAAMEVLRGKEGMEP